MKSNEPPQRKHVYFTGRVQGVGFRFTTRQIAADYEVSGFVRNLPDGRVELVAEGQKKQIETFLDELTGFMERYIMDTSLQDEPFAGEFDGFEIRF